MNIRKFLVAIVVIFGALYLVALPTRLAILEYAFIKDSASTASILFNVFLAICGQILWVNLLLSILAKVLKGDTQSSLSAQKESTSEDPLIDKIQLQKMKVNKK